MAYNEEKITGIGALKSLAQRLRAETPKNVSDLANDAKYQTEEQVAAAMAAAEHLQRKKVTSVEEISPTAEGADKFIYMVPKASAKDGDKYDEYMVLDGAVEKVGDWSVNLSGYQPKEEGKGLSTNDYTNEDKAKLDALEFATDAEVDAALTAAFGAAQE